MPPQRGSQAARAAARASLTSSLSSSCGLGVHKKIDKVRDKKMAVSASLFVICNNQAGKTCGSSRPAFHTAAAG